MLTRPSDGHVRRRVEVVAYTASVLGVRLSPLLPSVRETCGSRCDADFSFLILNEQRLRPFGDDCTSISRPQLVHTVTATENRNTLGNCIIAASRPLKRFCCK